MAPGSVRKKKKGSGRLRLPSMTPKKSPRKKKSVNNGQKNLHSPRLEPLGIAQLFHEQLTIMVCHELLFKNESLGKSFMELTQGLVITQNQSSFKLSC